MKANQYIAIDLGSSKITAMAAEVLDDGFIRILGIEQKASRGIEHGIINSHIADIAFAINELCSKLQNRAKIGKIKEICIALSAKGMKCRVIKARMDLKNGKLITDKLIEKLTEVCRENAKSENSLIYNVILQKYELDGAETDNPEGKTAKLLLGTYTVIEMAESIVSQMDKLLQRIDKKIIFNTPACEALSAALLDDEEREEGCGIIDFGAGNTSLSIYAKGVLQKLLIVPLGGKNITADIAQEGIAEELAEQIKIDFSNNPKDVSLPKSFNRQLLPVIIESRLEEIIQPIINEISNCKFPLNKGIIITGGASIPEYMPAYIAEKTHLNARHGDHSEWLCADSKTEQYLSPELSLCVGIITLANFSNSQQNTTKNTKENIFKKQIRKIRKWTNQLTIFDGFFNDEDELPKPDNQPVEKTDEIIITEN
ncbi:MAG: hypothetical protein LBV75_09950 [Paludibacter sp.]|jgi:cell division protein FtsA|nr:hypothetical protein [Paludibacter sp.]